MPGITTIRFVGTGNLPTSYCTDLRALIASVTSLVMYFDFMLLVPENYLWIEDSHYRETDCDSYELEI